MVELLGWLGFLLFASTLIPFVMRRLKPRQPVTTIFTRLHQSLALTSLFVLTFHGLFALMGRHGWRWGNLFYLKGEMVTGVIGWLGLLAVVLLALLASRKKTFHHTHCWFVILPVVATLAHVF
jgi:hypothetical protein